VGYVLRVREPDWYEHRMFRTPEKDVHIHIYSVGCEEIERVLVQLGLKGWPLSPSKKCD